MARVTAAVLAWMRLARVYHRIDRASAQHLRAHGLSVAQFDVLARVGGRPGLNQQELAEALLVTKGNICQLVDRLEADGLLARHPEGRANQLRLTQAGSALYARVVPAQERLVAEQLSGLSGAEQAALLELLRRVDRSLSNRSLSNRGTCPETTAGR